jgi:hypothetical protein
MVLVFPEGKFLTRDRVGLFEPNGQVAGAQDERRFEAVGSHGAGVTERAGVKWTATRREVGGGQVLHGVAWHLPLGTSASVPEQVAPFSGTKKPEAAHVERLRVLYKKTKKTLK